MTEVSWSKSQCEYLRTQAKQRFDGIRGTWADTGRWCLPHRTKWMLSQMPGERNNQHMVDTTHIIALRSFVAGFMEGNTSATRPWFRIGVSDPDINNQFANKMWLEKFTRKCHNVFTVSNFYHACGFFYYDFGGFGTGAHYIDERKDGLYFHVLEPGSYYVLNNGYGEAVVMVREFSLSVKALVDTYGVKENGNRKWDNFSSFVRKCYEDGNYTTMVDVVHIIKENENWQVNAPQVLENKRWVSLTYEVGGPGGGAYYQNGQEPGFGAGAPDNEGPEAFKYLKVAASRRKPFIVGRGDATMNYEYGEKWPALDALGCIKSLNKKALAKDQAIEQMIRPAMQGPANLRKSYITSAANSFVPLDPTSLAKGGLRPVFDMNPQIAALLQDQTDIRNQVDKIFYADYLLYLSRNPKTRTATETNAVVQEQQTVIGPNLQSLNWTYNVPLVDYVMDYVLFNDADLGEPPPGLQGKFVRPEFISVFAQAQRAADLPAIERYIGMIEQVGSIPAAAKIFDKANLDKLADLYEDRLFLPAGLNNPQDKVDAAREAAMAQMQKQQMMNETIPALAKAGKDVGVQTQNRNKIGG